MSHPVAITIHPVVPLSPSPHKAVPPPPVSPILPYFEIPCLMHWLGLFGSHKFSPSVKYWNCQIALQEHDCGSLVPHYCVPPNPMLAVVILTSARKVAFSSSKVKMTGKEPALTTTTGGTPMTSCSTVFPIPLTTAIAPSSVFVGSSLKDLAAGWANIAVDVVVGLLKGGSDDEADLVEEIMGVPNPADILGGVVKAHINYRLKGKGKVEVGIGPPFLNKKWAIEFENTDGVPEDDWVPQKITVESEDRLLIASDKKSYSWTWGEDEITTEKTSTVGGGGFLPEVETKRTEKGNVVVEERKETIRGEELDLPEWHSL